MDSDKILILQQQATEIFGTGKMDPQFVPLLKELSEKLLSSQTSDPNCIKITDEFQGLIYCLCKLCVVSHESLSNDVFFLVFRTIAALTLHFYALSCQDFSKFISEFPDSFAEPYVLSLVKFFFILEKDPKLQLLAISTLLLFLYFSDSPATNPFIKIIAKIDAETSSLLFEALEKRLNTTTGISLFYTLITQNKAFKEHCISTKNGELITHVFPVACKEADPAAELRLNILLILTKNENFSQILSDGGYAQTLTRELFLYARHSLKDEHLKSAVMTSLHVCVNLAQKLSGFDSDTAEMMIGLIRVLQVSKGLGDTAAEYCRLIVLFIESILVNRAAENVELLYCVMRATDTFRKMSFMKEKSKDPLDFARSLVNVEVIAEYFSQRLLEAGDKSNDYEALIKYLVSIIPDWKSTNILTIPPPSFDFQCGDIKSSLKFFKFVILKEVPKLL